MATDDTDYAGLMRAANAGDRASYAQLLQHTSRLLRPFLAKRLSQKSEVEDVLQEILLSIHKARHTYDGTRPYKPWAYAIAKFRLNDFLRNAYTDQLRHAGEISEAENISANDVTETPFTYESIKEEVNRLPGKQPKILYLLHHEGHTAKEVASKMNMSETAVKVAAHRAYKVLREKLKA